MSYLINSSSEKLVAVSPLKLKTNTLCTCSSEFVKESVWGCRELSPSINAMDCYVSNDAKWGKEADKNEMIDIAELINSPDEKSNRYEFRI